MSGVFRLSSIRAVLSGTSLTVCVIYVIRSGLSRGLSCTIHRTLAVAFSKRFLGAVFTGIMSHRGASHQLRGRGRTHSADIFSAFLEFTFQLICENVFTSLVSHIILLLCFISTSPLFSALRFLNAGFLLPLPCSAVSVFSRAALSSAFFRTRIPETPAGRCIPRTAF